MAARAMATWRAVAAPSVTTDSGTETLCAAAWRVARSAASGASMPSSTMRAMTKSLWLNTGLLREDRGAGVAQEGEGGGEGALELGLGCFEGAAAVVGWLDVGHGDALDA